MTANQIIKKLAKAGIDTAGIEKISSDEIEIWTGDADSSKKLMRKVIKETGLGGYKTGYGGWVLRSNYQSLGDWNDKSSLYHY